MKGDTSSILAKMRAGTDCSMLEVPTFHHGPRPLWAERRPRSSCEVQIFQALVSGASALTLPSEQAAQFSAYPSVQCYKVSIDLGVAVVVYLRPQHRSQLCHKPVDVVPSPHTEQGFELGLEPLHSLQRGLELGPLGYGHSAAQ